MAGEKSKKEREIPKITISCVTPKDGFIYGIHKPRYRVRNLRGESQTALLGKDEDGKEIGNARNFPPGDVEATGGWVYEIRNPFFFRGCTYINKEWAERTAADISRIRIGGIEGTIGSRGTEKSSAEEVSFSRLFANPDKAEEYIKKLPAQMQLALATTSTDAADLITLARLSCEFLEDEDAEKEGKALHLRYSTDKDGSKRAVIHNHLLFEAAANNPYLPNNYKIAMVIRPGAQGASEIVGEWRSENSHIYEYLRKNSYIAGGHYAANMAEDALRYSTTALSREDYCGLRHLYYQRTYVRLAEALGIALPPSGRTSRRTIAEEELEELRQKICKKIAAGPQIDFAATLWGWNYGFDYAPTGYRLHASHQQIHQQYAMIPQEVAAYSSNGGLPSSCGMESYSCGELITESIHRYDERYCSDFFRDYYNAILHNKRMDERKEKENSSLIIWQDENAMLFVPKAQTSQWEVQIMTLPQKGEEAGWPGNIAACDTACRRSLDTALFTAQRALAALGAKMVTTIEFSTKIGGKIQSKKESGRTLSQPLLYSLLPKLPESPGAFSEAQLRFINGHYPEDFAAACRNALHSSSE